jgi:hypothetical protein
MQYEDVNMENGRRYQRYAINQDRDTLDQLEIIVEGKVVQLVNFSVGGLYIISELPIAGKEIKISVNFKNRGKIDLIGNVIRQKKEGAMWGIAIDLSKTYNLSTLREV